jgi:hypothetical protein
MCSPPIRRLPYECPTQSPTGRCRRADRVVDPADQGRPSLAVVDKPRSATPLLDVLRLEGYPIHEIAHILKRNEKTIRRDIELNRDELALRPDPNLAARLIGEVVQHAETSIARLRRIARETSATALERATAEGMAWKVARDLTQLLQSLGYLPRSPVGIVASIHTQAGAETQEVSDDLVAELEFLERVVADSPIADSPEAMRCHALLEVARHRRKSSEIKTIQANVQKQETPTDEPPENLPSEEPEINDSSTES